ncbi:recombinase family protein [Mycolicibacterium chlorophenolicum]|nr:recombinase family protein [Mycolicibacterium chlorophenolicum]
MSGVRDDRPELAALLDYARRGDVLMVWRLDRLGLSRPLGPLAAAPAHHRQ